MQRCDMTPNLIRKQGSECKTASEIDEILDKLNFNKEVLRNTIM